jgi:hypothetical protein
LKVELVSSFEDWFTATFEDPNKDDDLQSTMHYKSMTKKSALGNLDDMDVDPEDPDQAHKEEDEKAVDPDALAFI